MKAITSRVYGGPEVFKLEEIPKPSITKKNHVLVKVEACSVNPADWHLLRADPFPVRFAFGLFKPRITILGADIAGTIEAIGEDVKELKVGDEVFGDLSSVGFGGYAEYVCVPEDALILKPTNMSFTEAAAVPMAAVTGYHGLQAAGKIGQGDKVLIYGASGGIGSYTIQIAKSYGAEVTTVCSTSNLDLVRSLGADHVIDYTKDDVTEGKEKYDVILDNAGKVSIFAFKNILKPKGRFVFIGGDRLTQSLFCGPILSLFTGKKFGLLMSSPNRQSLSAIKELIEKGHVKSHIGKTFPLSQVADAVRLVETGHSKGKTVIVHSS